jgi:site-specific DNA recombinase
MQAIGYDRVSTKRQAERGVMLEARSEAIPQYCQFKKWTMLEYYTDPGISGREGKKRPGFDKAMDAACQPGRVLVVDSLSRFVRSTVDAARALRRIQDAGAELVIVNLGIDTTTASGKLIYTIIAAVAEFESDQLGERMTAAHSYLKKTCGYNPIGQPAYGYARGKGERERVEAPAEQAIIAKARELRRPTTLCGPPVSFAKVAAQLNALGYCTRTGGPWYAGNVQRILRASKTPSAGSAPHGRAARVPER